MELPDGYSVVPHGAGKINIQNIKKNLTSTFIENFQIFNVKSILNFLSVGEASFTDAFTGTGGFIIKHMREEYDVSLLEMRLTTTGAQELRISVVDMDDTTQEIVVTVSVVR